MLVLFTVAVGFNEELYFRGLSFSFLSRIGRKQAVIGSAVVFGVLHAANALSGTNPLEVLLQIAFAFLAGLALAVVSAQVFILLICTVGLWKRGTAAA